jgi:predicted lysophospholipase L1 biosynthesis ABC-type transport system permease subunit
MDYKIHGLIAIYLGGMEVVEAENNMEKDTTIANVVTMGAVGMTVINTIQVLTILSLATAIGLNLILIYRNLKGKSQNK